MNELIQRNYRISDDYRGDGLGRLNTVLNRIIDEINDDPECQIRISKDDGYPNNVHITITESESASEIRMP